MPVLEAQVDMNLIPNPDNSDSDEMDNIEEEFERAMLEIESPNTRKATHQLSGPVTTVMARGMPEQQPFQSGCTPAFQGRQFLVWNTIGQYGKHRTKPGTLPLRNHNIPRIREEFVDA